MSQITTPKGRSIKSTHFLEAYLEWFERLLAPYSGPDTEENTKHTVLPLPETDNPVHSYFDENKLPTEHGVTILVLLIGHYFPERLQPFVNLFADDRYRGKIGGRLCEHTRIYQPSLQTVAFLLSGNDAAERVKYANLLEENNNGLFTDGTIEYLHDKSSGLGAPLKLNDDARNAITGNSRARLDSGENFPAKLATTALTFEEVVLAQKTIEELDPLFAYLETKQEIKNNSELSSRVKACYTCVFSGFPGTGKTVAAKTIGKKFGMDTYTLDLSRVVSKYIGEFEKAIDRVLTRLAGKKCILFIDEADSIFTKRLENVADPKDKHVNREMAYLLQRLEEYDGPIVLASNVANFRQHVDNAMLRRIRGFVQFPFPLYAERKKLWENALPKSFKYEEGLIDKLAQNFQLSGASIYSIVSDTVISAVRKKPETITFDFVEPHMKADFRKREITMQPCRDESTPQAIMSQRVGRQAMTTGNRM